ncbi:hypothetical protein F383_04044 [Gossypium arboreum]|uniref:Uncharacterized protein n=1 Tax=Gossypium arboreum TaxID=29729 RepID=A0A0B0P1U8_GOSAR|nr:hypothetical protein F383_04044 [Gossypium arboreum]
MCCGYVLIVSLCEQHHVVTS